MVFVIFVLYLLVAGVAAQPSACTGGFVPLSVSPSTGVYKGIGVPTTFRIKEGASIICFEYDGTSNPSFDLATSSRFAYICSSGYFVDTSTNVAVTGLLDCNANSGSSSNTFRTQTFTSASKPQACFQITNGGVTGTTTTQLQQVGNADAVTTMQPSGATCLLSPPGPQATPWTLQTPLTPNTVNYKFDFCFQRMASSTTSCNIRVGSTLNFIYDTATDAVSSLTPVSNAGDTKKFSLQVVFPEDVGITYDVVIRLYSPASTLYCTVTVNVAAAIAQGTYTFSFDGATTAMATTVTPASFGAATRTGTCTTTLLTDGSAVKFDVRYGDALGHAAVTSAISSSVTLDFTVLPTTVSITKVGGKFAASQTVPIVLTVQEPLSSLKLTVTGPSTSAVLTLDSSFFTVGSHTLNLNPTSFSTSVGVSSKTGALNAFVDTVSYSFETLSADMHSPSANTEPGVAVTGIADTSTKACSITLPLTGSTKTAVPTLKVSYTLTETASAGSVVLRLWSASTNFYLTLSATTSGTVNVVWDDVNATPGLSSCVGCTETLALSEPYSVTVTYSDVVGNLPVTSAAQTFDLYHTDPATVVASSPCSNDNVAYTVSFPSAPDKTSVSMNFTLGGATATLTFATVPLTLSAGLNTTLITVNLFQLSSSTPAASVTGAFTSLQPGSNYTYTVIYQDVYGDPPASSTPAVLVVGCNVNSVSPTVLDTPPGTSITVSLGRCSYFMTPAASIQVTVGGRACTGVSKVGNTLTCTSPGGAGLNRPVKVTANSLESVTDGLVDFNPPTVSAIQPQVVGACVSSGVNIVSCVDDAAQRVLVTGTNFGSSADGTPVITVGGSICTSPAYVTPDISIQCNLPHTAGAALAVVVTVASQPSTVTVPTVSFAAPTIFGVSGCPVSSNNLTSNCVTTGATNITVSGVNFGLGPVSIDVNGHPCTTPTRLTFRTATCLTPPSGGGYVPVTITAMDGSDTQSFLRYRAPSLSTTFALNGNTPATTQTTGSTMGGDMVTLTGNSFGPYADEITVTYGLSSPYNTYPCTVTTATDSSIVCSTAAGVGGNYFFMVTVNSLSGAASSSRFSYGPPSLTAVYGCTNAAATTYDCPTNPTGASARNLTIIGSNFGASMGVAQLMTTPTTALVCSFWNNSQAVCLLPEGQGVNLAVSLIQTGRTGTLASAVSYAPPTVKTAQFYGSTGCFNPSTNMTYCDPLGNVRIVVTGSNFGSSGALAFINGVSCSSATHSTATPHESLNCTVPAGTGGPLSVAVRQLNNPTQGSAFLFRYYPPVITNVTGCTDSVVSNTTIDCPVDASVVILTIFGSYFGASAAAVDVKIGNFSCVGGTASMVVPQVKLTCSLPPGIGQLVPVTVNVSSQADIQPYLSYRPPTVYNSSLIYIRGNGTVIGPGSVMTDLDSLGGETVKIWGNNFGLFPSLLQVGYGAAGVQTFSCVVDSALSNNTFILCKTSAGYGRNYALNVTSGNSNSVVLASISYESIKILPGVRYGSTGLNVSQDTRGGVVLLTVKNFGPDPSAVTVTYGPSLAWIDKYSCVPSGSSNATALLLICTMSEGVGANLLFRVAAGGWDANSTGIATVSYYPPILNNGSLTFNGLAPPASGFNGSGGDVIGLTGDYLGTVLADLTVYYGQSTYPLQYICASLLIAPNQKSLNCTTSAGFSYDHHFILNVGGQWSASATDRFNYSAPIIYNGTLTLDGSPPATFQNNTDAAGGQIVSFRGRNFAGGNCSQLQVYYGSGNSTKFVCAVINCTDSQIFCRTQIGMGANLTFKVHAGGLRGSGYDRLVFAGPKIYANTLRLQYNYPQTHQSLGDSLGGEILSFNGTNYGFDWSVVQVTYGPTDNPFLYRCQVDPAQFNLTWLSCNTSKGVGGYFVIRLEIEGAFVISTDMFSYREPIVTDFFPRLSGTSGMINVTLIGTDFGNQAGDMDFIHIDTVENMVSYPHAQLKNCSSFYWVNTSCVICLVPPGVGSGLAFAPSVGHRVAESYRWYPGFNYQPPVITNAFPLTGPADGTAVVTLTGVGFGNMSSHVDYLMLNASQKLCTVSFVNDTLIRCTVPAGNGRPTSFKISVGNETNVYTGQLFAFYAPVITNLSPTALSALGNQTLVIKGSNFGAPSSQVTAYVNGVECASSVSVSASEIWCTTLPFMGGPYTVSVEIDGQVATSSSPLVVIFTPFVSYIFPYVTYNAQLGSPLASPKVTVTGEGFVNSGSLRCACREGGTGLTASYINSTSVVCTTIPAPSVSTCHLEVTNDGSNFGSNGVNNELIYTTPPTLTSLSPSTGPVAGNSYVLVQGANFKETSQLSCMFGSVVQTAVYVDASSIVCITSNMSSAVGASIKSLRSMVYVSNNGAEFSATGLSFFFTKNPSISNISPKWDYYVGGKMVTVTGSDFFPSQIIFCRLHKVTLIGTYVSPTVVLCPTGALTIGNTSLSISINGLDYTSPVANVTDFQLVNFCPAQRYCPETDTYQPLLCPNGTRCELESNFEYQRCEPGTYQSQPGQSSCLPCDVGQQCPFFGMANYQDCAGGFICNDTKTTLPSNLCPRGFFCLNGTSSNQVNNGTYNPGWVNICPAQLYCNNGTRSNITVSGDYTTAQSCYQGFSCAAGSYRPQGNDFCRAGEFCNPSRQPCLLGHYCPINASSRAIPCDPGYYQDEIGAVACKKCPAGFVCPSSATTQPQVCTAGFICKSIGLSKEVDKCPAGFYCLAGTNTTSCINPYDVCPHPCPGGAYCLAGTAHPYPLNNTNGTTDLSYPQACLAGSYCQQGSPTTFGTDRCPQGYFCPGSATNATPARVGRYASGLGNSIDSLCLPGTFSNVTGLSQCLDCPLGFVCPDKGMSEPQICPAGFVCDQPQLPAASGLCPAGHYCLNGTTTYDPASPLSTRPMPCPNFTYCLQGVQVAVYDPNNPSSPQPCAPGSRCPMGSTSPSQLDALCPTGYYCPTADSIEPADPGYYCPDAGNVQQIKCPPNTYSNVSASSSCTTCPGGYQCVNEATVNPVVCAAGMYREVGSVITCQPCPSGTYGPNSAAAWLSDCLPCPEGLVCMSSGLTNWTQDSTPCFDGWVCPAGTNSSTVFNDDRKCPGGYYCPVGTSPTTMYDHPCPAGYYCSPGTQDNQWKPCNRNTYCPARSEMMLTCPTGSVSVDRSSSILNCTKDVTHYTSVLAQTVGCEGVYASACYPLVGTSMADLDGWIPLNAMGSAVILAHFSRLDPTVWRYLDWSTDRKVDYTSNYRIVVQYRRIGTNDIQEAATKSEFDSTHINKYIDQTFTVVANYDIEFRIMVQILHGRFQQYVSDFTDLAEVAITYPQRAQALFSEPMGFVNVLDKAASDNNIRLPVNLDGAGGSQMAKTVAAFYSMASNNITDNSILPASRPNKPEWWGSEFTALAMPHVPYIGNCEGFGRNIPLHALLETSSCSLQSPADTPGVTPFPPALPSSIQHTFADNCNYTVQCAFMEDLTKPTNQIFWFQANSFNQPLWYISRTAASHTMFKQQSGGSGEQKLYWQSLSGSRDLRAVKVVEADMSAARTAGYVPSEVELVVSFYQVDASEKQIVDVAVNFRNYKVIDRTNPNDLQYTLRVTYISLSYYQLLDLFAFDLTMYFLIALSLSIVLISMIASLWLIARRRCNAMPRPDLHFIPALYDFFRTSFLGFASHLVPIFVVALMVYIGLVVVNVLESKPGSKFDISFQAPQKLAYQTGRLSFAYATAGLYSLLVGICLLVPHRYNEPKWEDFISENPQQLDEGAEHEYSNSDREWRRKEEWFEKEMAIFKRCQNDTYCIRIALLGTCLGVVYIMGQLLEYSNLAFFKQNIYLFVVLLVVIKSVMNMRLLKQLGSHLEIAPMMMATTTSYFVVRLGAAKFLSFMVAYIASLLGDVFLRLVVNPIKAEIGRDPSWRGILTALGVHKWKSLGEYVKSLPVNPNKIDRMTTVNIQMDAMLDYFTTSQSVVAAMTTPVVLMFLYMFRAQSKITERTGVGEYDLRFFLIFSGIQFCNNIIVDRFVTNMLELNKSYKLRSLWLYYRRNYVFRRSVLMNIEPVKKDDPVFQSLPAESKPLHQNAFSPQYFFTMGLICTGMLLMIFSYQLYTQASSTFNVRADPWNLLVVGGVVVSCWLVRFICINLGRHFMWRIIPEEQRGSPLSELDKCRCQRRKRKNKSAVTDSHYHKRYWKHLKEEKAKEVKKRKNQVAMLKVVGAKVVGLLGDAEFEALERDVRQLYIDYHRDRPAFYELLVRKLREHMPYIDELIDVKAYYKNKPWPEEAFEIDREHWKMDEFESSARRIRPDALTDGWKGHALYEAEIRRLRKAGVDPEKNPPRIMNPNTKLVDGRDLLPVVKQRTKGDNDEDAGERRAQATTDKSRRRGPAASPGARGRSVLEDTSLRRSVTSHSPTRQASATPSRGGHRSRSNQRTNNPAPPPTGQTGAGALLFNELEIDWDIVR